MFILKSVTLRNFRSINDATFKPLESGVTGLSGENGVGKSSFLEGMLWALFDVRGDGITTKNLRRLSADESEESFVAVIFDHEGNEIEVIRELRGKNSRVIVSIFLDGLEQTHTSVRVANDWIRSRLRIDPDGFKTAFVVRQKELDSLVRARPAERRASIERLSGIEKLSEALKGARDKENTLKREVNTMPGSQKDVDDAAEKVTAQMDTLSFLESQLGTAEEESTASSDEAQYLQESATLLDEARLVRTNLLSINESLKAAQARLDAEGGTSTEITEEDLTQAQSEHKVIEGSLQEARTNHTEATAQKRELSNEQERLGKSILNYETSIKQTKEQLATIADANEELSTASGNLSELEEKVSRLASEQSRLRSENDNIANRISKIQNIITTLEESANNAHCPTCNSALEDALALTEDFREEMTTLKADESKNDEALASLKQEEDSVSSDLAKARVSVRSLQATVDSKPGVEDRLQSDTSQKTEAEVRQKSVVVEQSELDVRLTELTTEGKALAEEVQISQEKVQSLSKLFEDSQRIQGLVSERDEYDAKAQGEQGTLDALLATVETQQPQIPLDQVASRYEAALSQNKTDAARLAELKSDYRVQEERLSALERDASRDTNVFERKKAALKNLSELAAVSDTLDEFRKDRIAQIAPELSDTATALISSMTSGRFTEIILDEDFTPSVVNDMGETLFVSQLSGGEESMVALALRVAIGDLITGGVAGLLWLDEVLTAQDASRRSSLMSTLSHIAGRQIVLISHTPESTDSVDKIVNLVATDDGSFLAEE